MVGAQEVSSINYSLNAGLPSQETYFTYADNQGYVWIGTDAGLCRYDGYTFDVFTTENSPLTDNTIFKPYEAPNGEVWFVCYNGTITIYNPVKDELRPFEYNNKIREERFWIVGIYFDQEYAYLHHRFQGTFYHRYSLEDSSLSRVSLNTNDLKQIGRAENGSTFYSHKSSKTIYVKIAGLGIRSNIEPRPVSYLTEYDDITYFCLEQTIYATDGDTILLKRILDAKIETIHFIDQTMYVPTVSGLYIFDSGGQEKVLPNVYLTYMDIDSEGNIWASSLKNGIFNVASLHIRSLNRITEKINIHEVSSLHRFRGKLFIGMATEEEVYIYDETGIHKFIDRLDSQEYDFNIKAMYSDDQRLYIPGGIIHELDGDLKFRAYDGNALATANGWVQTASYNLPLPDNRIFSCGTYTGYAVQDLNNKRVDRYYEQTDNHRLFYPCLDSSGAIWAGSQVGLWRISLDDLGVAEQIMRFPSLNQRIDHVLYASGTKILNTRTNGLLFLRGNSIDSLQEIHGLISNRITDIYVQSDSVLWVGTSKGLSKVWLSSAGQKVLYNLNQDDGLPSNYVEHIAADGNELYLATTEGIAVVYTDRINPGSSPPHIYITSVDIARNPELKLEDRVFQYDQNDITIQYIGVTSKKPYKDFYSYRLVRQDKHNSGTDYINTNNTSVNFLDLNAGTYHFEVKCRNKNNVWSDVAMYQFTIKPHYSDTLWFRLALFIVILIILVALVYWRIKEIKSKNDKENHIKDLELKFKESELAILRNQMNPHFMFNALNSIQSYILQSDRDTASHYVQRFSKLMRSSLELSMDDWISLAVEIDFLTNYLTMEQMRFPERFSFEILVDPVIDPHDILLPPFLIQPIVENSVKHAFKNRESGGEIKVEFSMNNDELLCSVTDNGVGIDKSRLDKQQSTHKSYGIQVVRNRLRLILEDDAAEPLLYTDISKTQINQTGTKVDIKIPIE
jgi:ligand-binding sensor domain-containing protein/two-component sensor histidine kinase